MRSLLISAICVVGMVACTAPVQQTPIQPPLKPSEIGRYAIIHSSQVERDTILLDTVTGRTWSRVEVTDLQGDPPAWDAMPQLNTDADWTALRTNHPPKAKPK